MRSLTIKRISTNDDGTFGVLIEDTAPFALTLENPWLNNQEDVSCIPAGTYICKRIISPKFGETFEIKDVPKRTHILFHWGNLEKDTLGCICVAEEFGVLHGNLAILTSRNKPGKGFNEFLDRLNGIDQFHLTIVWV